MRLPALLLPLSLLLSGSLGIEAGAGSVLNFADVAGRHFHALKVDRHFGDPSDGPLLLYVERMGDARDVDIEAARSWLADHLGVLLVDRDGGLPLFLTNRDLVGSLGNDALGATIPAGIAVEARSSRLLGCALAHEVGHALGLRHSPDKGSIMAARCDFDKLDWAKASGEDRDHVARLLRIEALTVTGRVTWAER